MARMFLNDSSDPKKTLLVDNITRDSVGRMRSAYVLNGGWYLKINGNVSSSYDAAHSESPISQGKTPDWRELPVPVEVTNSSEAAFAWLDGSVDQVPTVAPDVFSQR